MSIAAVADLVLVTVIVLAAAGYVFWKLVLRHPTTRAPQVRVGGTLAKALANGRRERAVRR